MYKDFAKTAKEEGFDQIARLFEMVGEIEKNHEERFKTLLYGIKLPSKHLLPLPHKSLAKIPTALLIAQKYASTLRTAIDS